MIECNHSSVHLLQYSLREIISKDITQAGSKVDENTLRFDFNYYGKISDEELILVENKVNELIKEKIKRLTSEKHIDEIDKNEVMALFGEKYHDVVRLVEFNGSKELCGGTHVKNTGDIKKFAILSFTNKGSNTYRIEACVDKRIKGEMLNASKAYNDEIVKLMIKAKSIIQEAKNYGIELTFDLSLDENEILSYKDIVNLKNHLTSLQEDVKNLEKEFIKLKEEKLVESLSSLEEDIQEIGNNNILLKKVLKMDDNSLKQVMDNLANKYNNIFIMIANVNDDDTVSFLARSNNSNLNASLIVKNASVKSLGNGGGSPKFAQGGGKTSREIEAIFNEIINGLTNE